MRGSKVVAHQANSPRIRAAMSLEAILSQAVADGKLRQSSLTNIQSLLAASTNPLYRTSDRGTRQRQSLDGAE